MSKPIKAKIIREVSAEDIYTDLPDLHYTAIATLPADDALLIATGQLDEYIASALLALTPRRRGKLYLRAAAHYGTKQAIRLRAEEFTFYEALRKLRPELTKLKKRAKVTFAEVEELLLPINCIVGSCYVDYDANGPRLWHITRPELLKTFVEVPGCGGIYFLREINN